MPRIHQLDPDLVNKIAAGEVIERPASVVKELMENAIDAGATRIDVTIEQGGIQLIRVADDGCGMARDDLPLAVAPHATSKITVTDDLFNIRSLGFRGEALASIAAVSHLRICSRPNRPIADCGLRIADSTEGSQPANNPKSEIRNPQLETAYELATTTGQPPVVQATAAAPGTTVEIRNLFYNVPARRKFLRQPTTEFTNVTEQLARLALAHPQIAFTLTHNDRTARDLPATQDRRLRIADFYGGEMADCLLPIRRVERDLGIEALIAPPAEARASSKWQYLFLNGRYITDRRIGYAIREAFRGLMEPDRYPVVFIFLTTDPTNFDVNVHPTKIEVRWRDAGLVQSQVLAALRETLLSHDLTPSLHTTRSAPASVGNEPSPPYGSAGGSSPDRQQSVRQALADFLKSVDPTQARLNFQPPPFPTRNLRPSISTTVAEPTWSGNRMDSASTPGAPDSASASGSPPAKGGLGGVLPAQPAASNPAAVTVRDTDPAVLPDAENAVPPLGSATTDTTSPAPAIQIHNSYLVAETDEGVIIVDQHALHERILYERFCERILRGPLESQRLLIPVTLRVSPTQADAAEQNTAIFQQIGIDLTPFGPQTVAVQSFPALLPHVEIASFVADLLDKLSEPANTESQETLIHKALDMMACKAAVKAGDALTTEEITALLAQRHLVDRSSNCPHGRPTTLQLSKRDLERQFKRI